MAKVPPLVNYYTQQTALKEKSFLPEYKNIYSQVPQINLQRLDKTWRCWLTPTKPENLLVDHASTAQRFSL